MDGFRDDFYRRIRDEFCSCWGDWDDFAPVRQGRFKREFDCPKAGDDSSLNRLGLSGLFLHPGRLYMLAKEDKLENPLLMGTFLYQYQCGQKPKGTSVKGTLANVREHLSAKKVPEAVSELLDGKCLSKSWRHCDRFADGVVTLLSLVLGLDGDARRRISLGGKSLLAAIDQAESRSREEVVHALQGKEEETQKSIDLIHDPLMHFALQQECVDYLKNAGYPITAQGKPGTGSVKKAKTGNGLDIVDAFCRAKNFGLAGAERLTGASSLVSLTAEDREAKVDSLQRFVDSSASGGSGMARVFIPLEADPLTGSSLCILGSDYQMGDVGKSRASHAHAEACNGFGRKGDGCLFAVFEPRAVDKSFFGKIIPSAYEGLFQSGLNVGTRVLYGVGREGDGCVHLYKSCYDAMTSYEGVCHRILETFVRDGNDAPPEDCPEDLLAFFKQVEAGRVTLGEEKERQWHAEAKALSDGRSAKRGAGGKPRSKRVPGRHS